jgi:acetyltransferase-like isoleucine patch superfamily enzyme
MNLRYIVRSMLGRRPCVLHAGARLHSTARVVNIQGRADLIEVGASSIVRGELLVFAHGGSIGIGQSCYVGEGTRIWSASSIRIGSRVMISHGVNIFDNLTHPLDAHQRARHFDQISTTGHPGAIDLGERPVTIEDDAWIAACAIVLRGVTIGRGAIVGAGAVVTHDVPAFGVVAGNPARLIRFVTPAGNHAPLTSGNMI